MIATHHIKVNGRWYNPGEVIPGTEERKESRKPARVEAEPKAVVTETPKEAPKEEVPAEERPRSTARRNKTGR